MRTLQEQAPKRRSVLTALAVAASLAPAAAQGLENSDCAKAIDNERKVSIQSNAEKAQYCPNTQAAKVIKDGKEVIIVLPLGQSQKCIDAWNKPFQAKLKRNEVCEREGIILTSR